MAGLALIVASLAVGISLAFGTAFTVSGVIDHKPAPVTKTLYNYGSP